MKLEPQFHSLPELLRAFADIAEQCEGTKVRLEECWKIDGEAQCSLPLFLCIPERYEIAIAIVEDKPVWRGDELYDKKDGGEWVASKWLAPHVYKGLTWTPPNPNAKWKKLWEEGKRVQVSAAHLDEWIDIGEFTEQAQCDLFDNKEYYKFRLAPATITIEGEELVLPVEPTKETFDIHFGGRWWGFANKDAADKWGACIAKWMRGEK